ncbi:glycosyltransferase family 4 protein [Shewanella sp. A3A]|nr:glycosyltransferase family 4 protein [Shewanella ferrihydritica]
MSKKDVVILHDTDGHPYFQAVELLHERGGIDSLVYLESSVFFLLVRHVLKKKLNLSSFKQAFNNLLFRIKLPLVKNKTIIMGMGPYDFRFFFYSLLAYRNDLIYQTSWPYWWSDNIPKKYSFFTPLCKRLIKYCLNNRRIKIVCVSNAAHSTIIAGLSEEAIKRTYVIPHSVDVKMFSPRGNFLDWGKENRVINILFVGRLVPSKGLPLIEKLAKFLPKDKYSFTIIGDGELLEGLRKKYCSASGNVKVLGPIRNKLELAKFYKEADILLVPSVRTEKWEELFGIVLIEGLSAGLVVMASDHVGPREIIDDTKNGYLFADGSSFLSYANAIETLCKSESVFLSIKKNAVSYANLYSIDSVADKWFELIRE